MPIKNIHIEDISQSHSSVVEAIRYAVQSLKKSLPASRHPISFTSRRYNEMRRDMPYAIQSVSDSTAHILVNRNYKPLGSNKRTADRVDYDTFKNLQVSLPLEKFNVAILPGTKANFFDDESAPWLGQVEANQYFQRLLELQSCLAEK
jgi:hypothetical protein